MEYIAHRINTIEELKRTPKECGVELDLRDYGNNLILQHDPFIGGEDFEEYLKFYNHGIMILNIKSERVEFKVLELIKKYKVRNYFFLDCSFPIIYQLVKRGEKNIALRYSEYEGIDTIMNMKGLINWVWVDCFTKFPITNETYKILRTDFKLCLVSPELQGHPTSLTKQIVTTIKEMSFDAVCTKNCDFWRKEMIK